MEDKTPILDDGCYPFLMWEWKGDFTFYWEGEFYRWKDTGVSG